MNQVAAVFIDGKYLEKVLEHDYNDPRIDIGKLALAMSQPHEMFRAFFYHCWPWQSSPPKPEEVKRLRGRHHLVTALSYLPRFQVRIGKLAQLGENREGRPIFQKKQVDCMVGVDMALLAARGRISTAVLFTGDSDIVPAVEAVKNEGVLVTLWHGSSARTRPSKELFEVVDGRRELNPKLLEQIRFISNGRVKQ